MHRLRRPRMLIIGLLLPLVVALAGCDGGDERADTRDAQTMYDEAFDAPPDELSVINIPESAKRPTVGAVFASGDVDEATTSVHDALVDAGWTIATHTSDGVRGFIVGNRGEDNIQVELTGGDDLVSVNVIFAAPGEGL